MQAQELTAIATFMIAFSTFLAVGLALISYLFQIKQSQKIITLIYLLIYILLNLLILYTIIEWRKNEN